MKNSRTPGFPRRFTGPPGRRGAAMVEYIVTLGLISVMTIGTVLATGTEIKDIFDTSTEVISTSDIPESETPGSSGTPVAELEAPEDCVDVPDDQGMHESTTWPTAPCFIYRQEAGDTYFEFLGSDTRLIYTSGAADAGADYLDDGMWPAEIYGDGADNTMIIDGTPTQIGFDGYEGYDRIIAQGVNFSDVTVDTSSYNLQLYTPFTGSPAQRALDLFIYDCGVEVMVFDDGVYTIDQVLAAETPPDPLRPGPPGYPGYGCAMPEAVDPPSGRSGDPTDKPYHPITDGCLGDSMGAPVWCETDPTRPGDETNTPLTPITDNCLADAAGDPAWCVGDPPPTTPGDPLNPPYTLVGSTDPEGDPYDRIHATTPDACILDGDGLPVWCDTDDPADLPPDLELEEVDDDDSDFLGWVCVYNPSTLSFVGDSSRMICPPPYTRYLAAPDDCVLAGPTHETEPEGTTLWCEPTTDPLPPGLSWVFDSHLTENPYCAHIDGRGQFLGGLGDHGIVCRHDD